MQIIFNTSMPRSGSELLQVILDQNPDIYGSTTSPLLEYQYGARNNYGLNEVKSQNPELMKKAFLTMCKSMAEGYYSELTDKPIVCDKNRGWIQQYHWVEQWTNEPKMICMVRDLRSIIASLERLHQKNKFTGEFLEDPHKMQNLTLLQRVHHWLNSVPVHLALARVSDAFQTKVSDKVLFVRYESLCADPNKTMDSIYDYLKLPHYQHDFTSLVKKHDEDDSHYGIFGSHKVRTTLEKSENDWSSVLTAESAEAIKTYAPWYFQIFNY